MPKRLKEKPDLTKLNHTELVQLAQRIGMKNASRQITREALIESLQTLTPIEAENPFDHYRERYSRWLKANWDRVQMQVPRAHCPNCYKSPDMQIVDCWLDNSHRVT